MDKHDQRGRRGRHRRPTPQAGLGVAAIALAAAGLLALSLRSGDSPHHQALRTALVTPGPTEPVITSTAPPRPTTAPPATSPPPTTPARLGLPVTAVGDSLMVDMQPYLGALVPGISVDGAVSRPWQTGVTIVSELNLAGRLRPEVVVGLGANGGVTPAQFDAMMRAAAGARRVVFVNVRLPRSWQDETNATLRDGVARYPGTAVLADWYTLSTAQPSWFAPDGVHLQTAGAQAMASLVAGRL